MPGTIATLLKQQRPFSSPEQEALLGLRMTAARLIAPWAQFLKTTANLSTSQYNVLRILRGSHPGSLTCSEIGERTVARDPDVTRLVDGLSKRGLVRRTRSRTDRRVVQVEQEKSQLPDCSIPFQPTRRYPTREISRYKW